MGTHPLYGQWQAETDPTRQQVLWSRIYEETFGRNPQAQVAYIAKSFGYRSAGELIANETDAATQATYRRMAWLHLYGPEGGRAS